MDESERNGSVSLIRASPVLIRLAASASFRVTGWTLSASARAGTRAFRMAIQGESPARILDAAGTELREFAREMLGMDGDDPGAPDGRPTPPPAEPRPARPMPGPERPPQPADRRQAAGASSADWRPPPDEELRRRGAELLARSADMDYVEDSHPAFARVLDDMAPDEARILRLLHTDGPQPSVDVRQPKALVLGSQMVAPGLNMISAQAGCRFPDRVPTYLSNLYRLGVIWFSREPLPDPLDYQVLEAQPDVLEAMKQAGRGAKTVRRSIHLTPFGSDFCEVCLPIDITGEFEPAKLDPDPGP